MAQNYFRFDGIFYQTRTISRFKPGLMSGLKRYYSGWTKYAADCHPLSEQQKQRRIRNRQYLPRFLGTFAFLLTAYAFYKTGSDVYLYFTAACIVFAEQFSATQISQLYRLRWQIELLFKECKSHNNLQVFQTSNCTLMEALVWSSLIATILKRFICSSIEQFCQMEMSTLTVSKTTV